MQRTEMKKQSLYKTIYRSTLLLFALTTVSIVFFNGIWFYYDYQNEKKSIKKDLIETKKEILKNEVEFFISDIDNIKKEQKQNIKDEIKTRVDIAYNIVQNLYSSYKHKGNIQQIVVESLRELKFKDIGDQYVFMTKLDGTFLLTSGLKELEGHNVFDLEIKSNQESVKGIINMVKTRKKGFHEYLWQDHITGKFEKKISYFRYFKPFDCYIGTGVFQKDIAQKSKEQFLKKIQDFRTGENMENYIFAASYDGVSLTEPAKGKNVYEVTDANGTKVVQELIKIAKSGNGYLQYSVPVGDDITKEKISFVAGINDWGIYIGKGENLLDIDKNIQKKKEQLLSTLYNDISIAAVFGILFTLFYYIMSRYLRVSLTIDMENFIFAVKELLNKNKEIDTDNLKFKEFSDISEKMNMILEKKNSVEAELKNKESILYQQSKLAAMGEMLENIAHQWRQPLSVITTASSAVQLKKDYDMLDDRFLEESLETINENAEYLSETIEDFRNYFSPHKGKKFFMIKDIIDKSTDLLKSRFNSEKIKIIKDIEDFQINSYKNELVQVALVVLNNAKDVLEKFEGKRYIFINIKKDEDFAYICIKDNAGGIDIQIIDKIFEPYFTTKHKSQGIGIGLYMAKEIISKHIRGEIFVRNESFSFENEQFNGAEFTIKIPLKATE